MLEKITDDLWLAEGAVVDFYSFPYPTRMVIARFGNGDLWVWSPVKLTDDLKGEVDTLGPVTHRVSPNKIHYLYPPEWLEAYPDAALWGPASTIERFPALPFQPPLEDAPPAAWQPDMDQAWFQGSFAMDEVVFFYRPGQTVILANLIKAFSDDSLKNHWSWWQRPLAMLDGITLKKPGAPREWRLSFTDRKPARAASDHVLSRPAIRVIMAHGQWQRTDGHAFLKRALSWLGN